MQPSSGNLTVYDNSRQLAEAACQAFVDLASTTIEANGIFRVALSGGSTPKQLYAMLATEDLPWDRIHWYWGDERMVPHDHLDSNYRMVRETLLVPAAVPESSVFRVPTELENPSRVAAAYEKLLNQEFGTDGPPEFDLVLLGMGDDAHTASLFPGTAAIQVSDRWFVENWVDKLDTYRFTLTAPAINAASNIWFMITGGNKRAAIENVWKGPRDTDRFPSQMIEPADGLLWWLVTQDAVTQDAGNERVVDDL